MKKAIDLIEAEQKEQRKKHGFTLEHDSEVHYEGELLKAALFALTGKDEYKQKGFEEFEKKVWNKGRTSRYVVAATLMASEIDRLNYEQSKIPKEHR